MNSIDTPSEIKSPEAYQAAMLALNNKTRPPAVLRLLMNAFESYRQARKIGWSRPWNKYGVKTFQSFRLDLNQDTDLITFAKDLAPSDMPEDARTYVEDLLDDAPNSRQQLMGFLFFHEIVDGDQIHEGVTLSFGRKHQKRYRDRLDFVFEAPVQNGQAGSFSKLRIYVDPFQGVKPPLWETECDGAAMTSAPVAFGRLCAVYKEWQSVQGRPWDHWTSVYIDHFGPRRHFVENSHFPVFETVAT